MVHNFRLRFYHKFVVLRLEVENVTLYIPCQAHDYYIRAHNIKVLRKGRVYFHSYINPTNLIKFKKKYRINNTVLCSCPLQNNNQLNWFNLSISNISLINSDKI